MTFARERAWRFRARLATTFQFALLALALSCERQPAPTAARDAGVAARNSGAPSASGGAPSEKPRAPVLESAVAFDVAAVQHGAAFVRVDEGGKRLLVSRLDDRGRLVGSDRTLHELSEGGIVEVSAFGTGSRVAVAWIEVTQSGSRVRARVIDVEARREGAVLELGASKAPLPSGLVLSRRGDEFLVLAPGGPTPCAGSHERECYDFGIQRFGEQRAERWGLPLALPSPCARAAVGLAFAGDRHHYAVCSERMGKPVTTVFSIQSEPQYARAEPVLDGCTPVGAAELDGNLIVAGDCFGRRSAWRFAAAHVAPERVSLEALSLRCVGKRIEIRDPAGDGLRLLLDEPRSRVELFVPHSIARDGARAAWTGRALVVANRAGQRAELARYTCSDGELRRHAPSSR